MAGSRFLSALEDAGLEEVARGGLHLQFDKGAVIFREGEQAEGLHVLVAGRAKVYKTSPRGRAQTLLFARAGEPLGEVAALLGGRYPATAVALEPVKTVYLPRSSFLAAVRKNPEAAVRLLAVLAQRLRALTELVADLALRDVSERVASYILSQGTDSPSDNAITLSLSKKELATALGTVPETLSRSLAQLERAGAIESRGRVIYVRDRAFLAQLAGK
ncbi:MAG: Crp/Fnr family transcriptional regulator [Thermoleophilia bacterium]|nr:Crp/Fnr family transcriptional regulator [Thermoleophilia bacterium]